MATINYNRPKTDQINGNPVTSNTARNPILNKPPIPEDREGAKPSGKAVENSASETKGGKSSVSDKKPEEKSVTEQNKTGTEQNKTGTEQETEKTAYQIQFAYRLDNAVKISKSIIGSAIRLAVPVTFSLTVIKTAIDSFSNSSIGPFTHLYNNAASVFGFVSKMAEYVGSSPYTVAAVIGGAFGIGAVSSVLKTLENKFTTAKIKAVSIASDVANFALKTSLVVLGVTIASNAYLVIIQAFGAGVADPVKKIIDMSAETGKTFSYALFGSYLAKKAVDIVKDAFVKDASRNH